jgi:biopolymer transport protein ExbD
MDNDRYAATSAAQPALHRQSATPSRPVPKRGGAGPTAALAVGCLLFILLIAFLGAGGAALYVVSGSRDSDAGTEGKKDGPAARRPLEDRMREASGSEPDTAVPTVALGMPLQDGEVVFVAPSAVLHNQETLATVSMGRVAVAAKPNADSPLVLPLARSLEAAFAKEFSDPLDAENAIRWVVVLVDGKVGYRTVFEVLYTCWERGARMQLAATNPTNPNSYVAVEVMADGWPSPERAGSPDDLPRRVEEAMDSKSNALTVKITDKGFLLWAPGEKENEAVKLDRLTAYPTSQLQKYSAALQRDPRIRAMRVRATEDTSLFVVLQAIAAVTGAKSEPQVTEVRLVPPEKD